MAADLEVTAETLLVRARVDGKSAIGRLLEHYRNYLTLLARQQIGRRLQGKVDSADLVQETFLHAHRDFERFRGRTPEALAGWLRQILAARLGDLVRRYVGAQRRNVNLERDLVKEIDESSHTLDRGLIDRQSSPSKVAARREQAVLLADALEQLPRDYREVLILHNLEEYDFLEVATRMGRTVEAVKKLWARALGQLRPLLKGNP